jgi:hypothetical protein
VTDLVPRSEEGFALPEGVLASETGLDFSSATGLVYDEWETLGGRLGRLHSGIQWWLGDWFAFGEARFRDGEMYEQALEETGRSVGGLYNLKWVAEKVPPQVRRADLSWSHHREVAKLPPEDQAAWLARASEGRWSVDLLRSTVRAEMDLTTWRGPVEPSGEIEAAPAQRDDADRERIQGSEPMLQVETLREVAAEIVAADRDEHGRVCLGANLLERLRAALDVEAL